MTRSAMIKHMTLRPFQPFVIKMNNGEIYSVHHPELAILMRDDTLYVFQPASEVSGLNDDVDILRIHNICSIHKHDVEMPDSEAA